MYIKYVLYCIVAVLFLCCADKKNNSPAPIAITINYKVVNADSLRLHNHLGYEHYIKIDSNGQFSDTLFVEKGYYQLSNDYDTLIKELFLDEGFNLTISISAPNAYKLKQNSKSGYNENTYLANKNQINTAFKQLFGIARDKDENQFLRFCDSIHNLEQEIFNIALPKMAAEFSNYEKVNLEAERLNAIASYPGLYYYINKLKVSEKYPRVYQLPIDYNDSAYMRSSNAYYFLNAVIKYHVGKVPEHTRITYNEHYSNWLQKHISNPNTAKHFLFKNGLQWLQTGVAMDSVYKTMVTLFPDKSMKNKMDAVYNAYKPIERGQPAPNFVLKNDSGVNVSLESFKGKVVYIDFWGTYCKPCFNLMPALNTLEKEFHGQNVAFIGIGMDKDDALWLKRIQQFQMGGIQLRSESRDHPFLTHFKVYGIPRFLLLDQNGNVVDAYAKEPNDPELKTQIKTLLL